MPLFRSRPTRPLSEALELIDVAHIIIRRHRRKTTSITTHKDIRTLDNIARALNGAGDEIGKIRQQWQEKATHH